MDGGSDAHLMPLFVHSIIQKNDFLNSTIDFYNKTILTSLVRTDLGTDSGPHPVNCKSAWCRSIFVAQHHSNNTGN